MINVLEKLREQFINGSGWDKMGRERHAAARYRLEQPCSAACCRCRTYWEDVANGLFQENRTMSENELAIDQSIGWLKMYAGAMIVENWKDMRDRIARELETLAVDISALRIAAASARKAITELCDVIEDDDQHGGGADETGCPICDAMRAARAAATFIDFRF